MLPTLPSDSEFFRIQKFPHPEGQQIEYKRSASEACLGSGLDKMKATLCAFLNCNGGHFICGIDDASRDLLWVNTTSKRLDLLLLQIDDIMHRMAICTTDYAPLDPSNIVTRVITKPSASGSMPTSESEIISYILVVTAIPTPGVKYKYRGNMWYRLNASNYAATDEISYGAAEVRYMMAQQRKKIYADMAPIIDARCKQILEMEHKIAELERALLFTKILSAKAEAEKVSESRLRSSSSPIALVIWSIFCC